MAKKQKIGRWLIWARQQAKLTRAEAAKKMGCCRTWMHRVETDKNEPSFRFVEDLFRLYGMHPERGKLGKLPQRLAMMQAGKRSAAKLRQIAKVVPDGAEQLELAERGIRMPGDHFLRLVSVALRIPVEDMLYGDE